MRRAEIPFRDDAIDRAHYAGAARFHPDYDGALDWRSLWTDYLDAYTTELEIPEDRRAEASEHLEAEFSTAAIWRRLVPGCREALAKLAATGVTLGVVSNADGDVGARLRDQEVLQLGPGPGTEVATIVDSGQVGVMKPDPRIFHLALVVLELGPDDVWYVGDMPAIDVVGARRAGIRPIVMDPYGFNAHLECDRVTSLADVAAMIDVEL